MVVQSFFFLMIGRPPGPTQCRSSAASDVYKRQLHISATEHSTPVDTIFEIGGQDSKFISIENGVVVDFAMNEACAAGTGSFLEEQAEKLGISIKGEFAKLALSSEAPTRLGERCTVFMERDVTGWMHKGEGQSNLLAGLAYSIALNYLNRVVRGRKIGDAIYFQGGTAYNDAVAAAFAGLLGKTITVPPGGGCLTLDRSDLPPLTAGRYYIGVYNPNPTPQTVRIVARLALDPAAIVPLVYGGTGETHLLDDAITNATRVVTNDARIASVEVGLRIDHPRVSDLAITLVSPQGTRLLLTENRGGTDPSGFGSTYYVTNVIPVSYDGANEPITNVIDVAMTAGTLTIDYEFYSCLLYTSPSPRDRTRSRMPSSA